MQQIPLTKGHFALVDDADFEWLSQWKWCASEKNGKVYAKRTNKSILMHRVIMGVTDPKIKIDHEDLTGNNNQRHNLRLATHSQNLGNRLVDKRSTSGFKGVSYSKTVNRFRAYIVKDYKQTLLGYSDCPKTCARTYNKAAKEIFGKFASLNVVEDGPLCIWENVSAINTTGFRGVEKARTEGNWAATIQYKKKKTRLGVFDTPELAARAYDAKAIDLYGPDYKKLNFPNLPTP